jgi:tyrosinase
MRLNAPIVWAPLLASTAATFTPASTSGTDALAASGLLKLAINETEKAKAGTLGSCTLKNAVIRKEW